MNDRRRLLLIAVIAFLAAIAGAFIGRAFISGPTPVENELHALLHRDLDLNRAQEAKMEAIRCYASQFVGNSAFVPDMVRTVSAYFGSRIGTAHAEPFYTHEMLGFGGLDQLI